MAEMKWIKSEAFNEDHDLVGTGRLIGNYDPLYGWVTDHSTYFRVHFASKYRPDYYENDFPSLITAQRYVETIVRLSL